MMNNLTQKEVLTHYEEMFCRITPYNLSWRQKKKDRDLRISLISKYNKNKDIRNIQYSNINDLCTQMRSLLIRAGDGSI